MIYIDERVILRIWYRMGTVSGVSAGVDLSFEAPGPGFWELEAGHHGRRPLSACIAVAYRARFEDGIKAMLANYGAAPGPGAIRVRARLYLRSPGWCGRG